MSETTTTDAAATPPANRGGRPSSYTPEIAAEICERLAAGETLMAICRDDHMPADNTVRKWAIDDREGFHAIYARARELGYERMAEELLEISDDGTNDWVLRNGKDGTPGYELNGEHVQRSRLRADTRKWLLAKVLPKVYGDRTQHDHSGTVTLEALVSGSFAGKTIEHDPKEGGE